MLSSDLPFPKKVCLYFATERTIVGSNMANQRAGLNLEGQCDDNQGISSRERTRRNEYLQAMVKDITEIQKRIYKEDFEEGSSTISEWEYQYDSFASQPFIDSDCEPGTPLEQSVKEDSSEWSGWLTKGSKRLIGQAPETRLDQKIYFKDYRSEPPIGQAPETGLDRMRHLKAYRSEQQFGQTPETRSDQANYFEAHRSEQQIGRAPETRSDQTKYLEPNRRSEWQIGQAPETRSDQNTYFETYRSKQQIGRAPETRSDQTKYFETHRRSEQQSGRAPETRSDQNTYFETYRSEQQIGRAPDTRSDQTKYFEPNRRSEWQIGQAPETRSDQMRHFENNRWSEWQIGQVPETRSDQNTYFKTYRSEQQISRAPETRSDHTKHFEPNRRSEWQIGQAPETRSDQMRHFENNRWSERQNGQAPETRSDLNAHLKTYRSELQIGLAPETRSDQIRGSEPNRKSEWMSSQAPETRPDQQKGNAFDFDSYTSTGPRGYYESFPSPWNEPPRPAENNKRDNDVIKLVSRSTFPIFKGENPEEYYAWRSAFITYVHRSNADVQSKILALSSVLSDKVKAQLGASLSFTARGYFECIKALERKFGGSKRLLRNALGQVRGLGVMQVNRIEDIEKYVQTVSTYFSRLSEAGLSEEKYTQSALKDVLDPFPWEYSSQYYEFLETNNHRESAESVLIWAKKKLERLRRVYENQDLKSKEGQPKSRYQQQGNAHVNTESDDETEDQVLDMEESEGEEIDRREEAQWAFFLNASKRTDNCVLCSAPEKKADHENVECPVMKIIPVEARKVIFTKFQLCYCCGSVEHQSKDCKGAGCNVCKYNHHPLLHKEKKARAYSVQNTANDRTSLLTITVEVVNPEKGNKKAYINCLLDSGSQLSLLSTRLAEKLELKGYPTPLSLFGAGGKLTKYNSIVGEIKVRSIDGKTKQKLKVQIIDSPAGAHRVIDWTDQKEKFPFMRLEMEKSI